MWEQHEGQILTFVVVSPAVVPWYYAIYISEDPKSALRGFEISSKLRFFHEKLISQPGLLLRTNYLKALSHRTPRTTILKIRLG